MQSHAKSFARIQSDLFREGVSSLISNISCTKQSNLLLYRELCFKIFSEQWSVHPYNVFQWKKTNSCVHSRADVSASK